MARGFNVSGFLSFLSGSEDDSPSSSDSDVALDDTEEYFYVNDEESGKSSKETTSSSSDNNGEAEQGVSSSFSQKDRAAGMKESVSDIEEDTEQSVSPSTDSGSEVEALAPKRAKRGTKCAKRKGKTPQHKWTSITSFMPKMLTAWSLLNCYS